MFINPKSCQLLLEAIASKSPNLIDFADDIHVVPADNTGKTEHESSVKCFCEPTLYYKDALTGVRCFMHKSKEEMSQ